MARKSSKSFADWKKAGGRDAYSKRLDAELRNLERSPSRRVRKGLKQFGKGARRVGRGVRDGINAPLELAFRSKIKK